MPTLRETIVIQVLVARATGVSTILNTRDKMDSDPQSSSQWSGNVQDVHATVLRTMLNIHALTVNAG